MRQLYIDNYVIHTPILEILNCLQQTLLNGKLKEIKSGSDNIVVTCPHHNAGMERKAALNIYIGDNNDIPFGYARCFVCDFNGPFYHFVAECFNASDAYAKKWLIDTFDSEQAFEVLNIGEPIRIPTRRTTVKQLDASILDTYQSYCPYLASRKLSRATCERFNVKYDPKFRQIIFPCYDTHGRLIMLPKRAIDYKKFYLDRNVDKPVYCLDYIIKNNIKQCVITEGPFDCLTAYEFGMPAIATFGAISDGQIAQINKSCITILFAMFDNDAAGQKFTDMLKKKLDSRILVIDVRFPSPQIKDINDMTREQFNTCITQARIN